MKSLAWLFLLSRLQAAQPSPTAVRRSIRSPSSLDTLRQPRGRKTAFRYAVSQKIGIFAKKKKKKK
jgi:hypothetical protein